MKRRERSEVKKSTTIFTTHSLVGLKSGQEVVPPFWAQTFDVLNLLKPLFSKHFQEQLVVAFFGKGYVRKRAQNKTNSNCLGGL